MQAGISTGTLIDARFEVEHIIGRGGMGTVYRARDRATGGWVAVKVLHRPSANLLELRRFEREARILAELRHPGIAQYVTSGQTPDGQSYLVMEWIEGEDLARRLSRGPLSLSECCKLIERVAAVLACAHQVGIVHRDIKPSNLFLCDGRFHRVVLLDFGVAHCEERSMRSALTMAGAVVGTLQYMAPEQARGDSVIRAAADIYALGRVAYQAISGQARSASQHVAAELARTLFEPHTPLHVICPFVPLPLSGLIGRMLSKESALRPENGAALSEEMQMLGPMPELPSASTATTMPVALADEQGLYSIVLAVPVEPASGGDMASNPEISSEVLRAEVHARQVLEATLNRHGARACWLLDGSLLLTMAPSESAHDQAASAARAGLLVKERWPSAAVALATGRGRMAGNQLIGEAVDRAAQLLRSREASLQGNAKAAAAPVSLFVDALSASLLERHFTLLAVPGGALLTGERSSDTETLPVLGTLPPCIGREHELSILDTILTQCREEQEAHAVLIMAPPGLGKSRIRQEFLLRARRRSYPVTVLLGVGEVLSAGAPYALLGQALRRLFGIAAGAGSLPGQQRLTSLCVELLGDKAAAQVVPFLGEVCGVPFAADDYPELRAVRGDPRAMATSILHALTSLLSALCERSPVIWVLDDLQWGDQLTTGLVGNVLRELDSRSLMVLALGRPEVKSMFPKIRHWPRLKELTLGGLSRGASERLVRFVLGDKVAPAAVVRIVQQAAGNVLLLEEMIRAIGEQREEPLPETVLAILQVRLQRLEPRERLVLAEASIFGERFWRGGLLQLASSPIAGATPRSDLDADLQSLAQAELIAPQKQSRIKGEVEFAFRHTLMREAAYGLILDAQKRRWHRDAGQFLERAGEPDALVLAEHFSRSDQPHRAAPHFAAAARLALDGNDLVCCRSCVQRGLDSLHAAQGDGELRGALLAVRTEALYRTSELSECLRSGEEALALLTPGSARCCRTFYWMFSAAFMLGQVTAADALAERFMALRPSADADVAYIESAGALLSTASMTGQRERSRAVLDHILSMIVGDLRAEPAVEAWLRYGQQKLIRLLEGDPWAAWRCAEEATAAAVRSGNARWMGIMQCDAALAEGSLGSEHEEEKLRAALVRMRGMEQDSAYGIVASYLALVLSVRAEQRTEASALAREVLARHPENGFVLLTARWALSNLHALAGEPEAAEREAREALHRTHTMTPLQLGLYAHLLGLLDAQGKSEAAQQVAQEGRAKLESLDGVGYRDLDLRLALIEHYRARGDREAASRELGTALNVLRTRSALIPDPSWRASYLERVTVNASLCALEHNFFL